MKKKTFRKLNIKLKRAIQFSTASLKRKLLINHILLIILPVLTVFYFIYNIYTMDKRQEAINLTHIANQQAMERIDALIADMEELTKQPIYDAAVRSQSPTSQQPDIMGILRESNKAGMVHKNEGSIIPDEAQTDPSANTYANTTAENTVIDKLLKRILLFNDNIHSVFLFNNFGQYDYRMEQYSLRGKLDCYGEEWFQKCLTLKGKAYFFIGKEFRDKLRNLADKEYHFSIARAVMDTQSVKPLGVICINIDKSFFRDICRDIMTIPGERVLILDEADRIVYDTEEENILKLVEQSGFNMPELTRSENKSSIQINGEKFLIDTVNSVSESLKLVRIIPEDKLFVNLKIMQQQFLLLILISVFLSLLLSIYLTYGITKPMKRLISTMRVVEKGDLSIRFSVRQKDEIGLLGRSFNKMIRKIEKLINIVYISQIRKKEAELDALQTQINPHFIYNTLESIRMMAELNDDAETSRMTFMLARLLRYSISTKKQKVTVKQEVEHLNNYLELQNMRFEDKFQLVVDLDEELYHAGIIKLVFQPVVENAIVHGFEGIEGKGVIRISGRHEEGRIVLCIEDNGKGIPAEQLEELNRKINDFSQNDGEKGSIGLKNVNERIQLHYGESFGIRLCSEPDKGTVVILEFPDAEPINKISA